MMEFMVVSNFCLLQNEGARRTFISQGSFASSCIPCGRFEIYNFGDTRFLVTALSEWSGAGGYDDKMAIVIPEGIRSRRL
jgi:hypothetical protein